MRLRPAGMRPECTGMCLGQAWNAQGCAGACLGCDWGVSEARPSAFQHIPVTFQSHPSATQSQTHATARPTPRFSGCLRDATITNVVALSSGLPRHCARHSPACAAAACRRAQCSGTTVGLPEVTAYQTNSRISGVGAPRQLLKTLPANCRGALCAPPPFTGARRRRHRRAPPPPTGAHSEAAPQPVCQRQQNLATNSRVGGVGAPRQWLKVLLYPTDCRGTVCRRRRSLPPLADDGSLGAIGGRGAAWDG